MNLHLSEKIINWLNKDTYIYENTTNQIIINETFHNMKSCKVSILKHTNYFKNL